MNFRGKRGLAAFLSGIVIVTTLMGPLSLSAYANDNGLEEVQIIEEYQEQITQSLNQPQDVEVQNDSTVLTEPTQEVEEGLGLKQSVIDILKKTQTLTDLTEEQLEQVQQEIEAVEQTPLTMSEESDGELQDLLGQLANAQVAVEDMQRAYQAQREGWLNQLDQTGKENSWRYQNGQSITPITEEQQEQLDLPDGVSAFSVQGYWGIDVSHHQGVIDWDAVKAAGIDFAIIRCGFGMNIESQDDRQWSRNVAECERLGIPYGVYFYSYATNVDMAREEAEHALRLLNNYSPDLPVFYDMEENRMLVVGNSGLAQMAQVFCDAMEEAGYDAGVYASLSWWNYYLTDAVFENWYRWVAQWGASCTYNGRYEIWQYTNKGYINGISSGPVDMNYWYGALDIKSRLIYDEYTGQWKYYTGSKWNQSYTGVVEHDGGWFYVENGVLNWNYTGMASNDWGWHYIKNGVLDRSYTGIAENPWGKWYISQGSLDFNKNGIVQVGNSGCYIKNGKWEESYTGVVEHNGGWFYVENGVLNWNYTGMASNDWGWHYIKNGVLDRSYTGIAENPWGKWYISQGSLDFNKNGLVQIGREQYYIKSGQWMENYTGKLTVQGKQYSIKNGIVVNA